MMGTAKPADRPETFVALRARHEAMRIAEAILRGGGVDVQRFNCHACGSDLDWNRADTEVAVDCPACGAINELPCHLRYRLAPSSSENGVLEYQSLTYQPAMWWEQYVPLAAAAEPAATVGDEGMPFWVKAFCLACVGAVLIALTFLLLHFR